MSRVQKSNIFPYHSAIPFSLLKLELFPEDKHKEKQLSCTL